MISVNPNLEVFNCDKYLEDGEFIDKKKGYDLSQRDFLGLQEISNAVSFYRDIRNLEKKTGCDYCKANFICNGECQSYMISKYGEYRLNTDMCEIFKRCYDFISDNWVRLAQHGYELIPKAISVRNDALRELEKHNMRVLIDDEHNNFKVVKR